MTPLGKKTNKKVKRNRCSQKNPWFRRVFYRKKGVDTQKKRRKTQRAQKLVEENRKEEAEEKSEGRCLFGGGGRIYGRRWVGKQKGGSEKFLKRVKRWKKKKEKKKKKKKKKKKEEEEEEEEDEDEATRWIAPVRVAHRRRSRLWSTRSATHPSPSASPRPLARRKNKKKKRSEISIDSIYTPYPRLVINSNSKRRLRVT